MMHICTVVMEVVILNGGTKKRKNGNSNSIPIQVDIHSPELCENGIHIAVYVKCDNFSIIEISNELLRYIEGQTHIVCATHNLPMITVPDRKATCACWEMSYFSYTTS